MISKEAIDIYEKFRAQEGSEYIATPVSIQAILDIVRKEKPRYALEMGSGIGTLSYVILSMSDAQLDLYEDNDFCQRALGNNLAAFAERYTLMKSYDMMPTKSDYDLFIVDGGNGKRHDGGSLRAVQKIANTLKDKPVICYVEGHRYSQRTLLRKVLRERFVYKQREFAPAKIGSRLHKGGGCVVLYSFQKPSVALYQLLVLRDQRVASN